MAALSVKLYRVVYSFLSSYTYTPWVLLVTRCCVVGHKPRMKQIELVDAHERMRETPRGVGTNGALQILRPPHARVRRFLFEQRRSL